MARRALSAVVEQARITASRTVPDAELLEQFLRTGDEAAFADLVRRHRPTVLAACRQVLADDADVDDAAQQAFLALWRSARSIRNRQSVGGWLFGVAHRLAVMISSRSRRRSVVEGRARERRRESSPTPDISWREACAILHEELDRLADKHRLPLLLCYLDGKSRDEAAKHLGWSVGALKGHLQRGRIKLRARLARRGVTLSAGLLAATAAAQATAGPALPTVAILRAMMQQPLGPTKDFWTLAWASRGVRRIVLLAALTVTVVGGVVRLGILTHDDPPAPAPTQIPAVVEQPRAATSRVTVSGRVLDPDGKPVPGAKLYSVGIKSGHWMWDSDLETFDRGATGPDGRFRFEMASSPIRIEPVRDPRRIMAAAEGYGLGWTVVTAPEQELTIRLVKDNPIFGRILDGEGRPVTNAEVSVRLITASGTGNLDNFLAEWRNNWRIAQSVHLDQGLVAPTRALRVSRTDAEGRFSIHGCGVDRVVFIVIRGPTVAQSIIEVVNRRGFDTDLYNRGRPSDRAQLYAPSFDFVGAPGKRLSGVVRGADGTPAAGAQVVAFSPGNVSVATSDAEGRYAITSRPKQSQYSLTVQAAEGSALLGRSVTVTDSPGLEPIIADVTLARGVLVTGRVIEEQSKQGVLGRVRFEPLPENVSLQKPEFEPHKRGGGVATDPDGRFRIPVIPGAGVLMVQIDSGESLDGQFLNPYASAKLTAEERQSIKVVGEGHNAFFATAGGFTEPLIIHQAVKYLNLSEVAGTTAVELRVSRGRTARLAIQDPDGKPLEGAIVSGLAGYAVGMGGVFRIKSGDCTVFALDPETPRTLVIYHPDRNLGAEVIVRGDETAPVAVKLQPAGVVTGRFLDADGKPVSAADVQIRFMTPHGESLNNYLPRNRPPLVTDQDGRFRLEEIIPGTKFVVVGLRTAKSILRARGAGGVKEVKPGATLDLGDLRAEPPLP